MARPVRRQSERDGRSRRPPLGPSGTGTSPRPTSTTNLVDVSVMSASAPCWYRFNWSRAYRGLRLCLAPLPDEFPLGRDEGARRPIHLGNVALDRVVEHEVGRCANRRDLECPNPMAQEVDRPKLLAPRLASVEGGLPLRPHIPVDLDQATVLDDRSASGPPGGDRGRDTPAPTEGSPTGPPAPGRIARGCWLGSGWSQRTALLRRASPAAARTCTF